MKKISTLFLIGALALVSMGFSSRMPLPDAGIYDFKMRTLTFFDLMTKEFPLGSNTAEVIEAKPDYLAVQWDAGKLDNVKYGYFKLGNHDQKTWFGFGKNPTTGKLDFYIDQNGDNRLDNKEKVESLDVVSHKSSGYAIEEYYSLIPAPLTVTYKGYDRVFQKKLYFFFDIQFATKKNSTEIMVGTFTASFLEGEMTVQAGKTKKQMKVRLMDANGNGCFNDYGKDLIYMDINSDDYFRKRESQPITEFYDFPGPNQQKQQLRFVVLPMPAKVAVVEATADFDRAQLEGAPDRPAGDGEAAAAGALQPAPAAPAAQSQR
jgi:hypothetical protein